MTLSARSTAAVLTMLMAAAGTASAQVVDNKVPLNYNYHGLAHAGETVAANNNFNADVIKFRSIADRGIFWDPTDFHAFGTNPIIGATGITYSLFNSLGYTNTAAANASSDGLDCVHLGNRVWNNGFEFFTNTVSPGTSTGPAPSWAPIIDIATLSGDGTTATATTAAPHGLSVGQVVAIIGATPVAFDGNVTITAVPDATTFQYASTANTAATGAIFSVSTSKPQISALSVSGTTVTATTIWPHGFGTNNTIHVTGASDPNFNIEANTVTVPTTSSFTYTDNLGPVGTPTGQKIVAATCIHDTADQVTTLSSPVTLDANSEIGVLYTISNGDGTTGRGGSFDVVLTFTDSTTVTTRLHGNNWDSTVLPNIVSNLVTSQQLIKHTFGGTTSSNFRSVSNTNDAATLNTFGTTNIGVMEGIISVPAMTASGISVVGKTLSKVTFKNSFYNPTQITALSFNGTTATATIASNNSPFVPGQPITISGVNPNSLNGNYNILSVSGGTSFTFANSTPAGTGAAKMYANGLGIATLSLAAATGTVTLDAPGQLFNVGDRVTITGVNASTGTSYANGVFTVASATDATHFTYKNGGTSGTITAQMHVTRPGEGRGYQVHAVTVRNGQPTNTTCAAAPVLTGPVASTSGTNAHVVEAAPPTHTCGTTDNSAVYYSYVAIGNNPITITTCSSFSPSISVYTGTCGGTLTQVTGACTVTTFTGCGGSASGNVGSTLTFSGTSGTTYFIRIAGQSNAWGPFSLGLSETVNASCSGALPITTGDTSGQTFANANGGTTPCGGGFDTNAIWYQYTVSGSGTHLVEARTCLDGQNATLTPAPLVSGVTGVRNTSCTTATPIYPLDTTLAVYTMNQCGLPSPTPIICNDNGCSVSSRLQWMGTAGTTYLIRVASKSQGFPSGGTGTAGATGSFIVHIDDPVHTDLAVPLTFNWNGICHGTKSVADANFYSEQNVTSPANHENRTDLNGYRSISDRGLLFDPNNTTPNAFNYGGTVGYQGMQYTVYGTALQNDLVHVAQQANPYRGAGFEPNTTSYGAISSTAIQRGYLPLWLAGSAASGTPTYDHYSNVVSDVSAMNAVFGANTKLGLIYHMTNLGANVGSFRVTLTFNDNFQAIVTCNGTDWFGGNSASPCGASLPATLPAGVEAHRILGVYNAVQNVDRADAASTGQLKVAESVISTATLTAAGQDPRGHGILRTIKFDNVTSSDTGTNVSIFAAALRDPLSYNFTNGPSAIGTVAPNMLNAGGTGTMTVNVILGSAPSNTISSVVVDATAIGLGSNFALNVVPGSGTTQWTRLVSFPVNTAPNAFSLPFTATDAQGRIATGNIIFSVVAPSGSIVPNPVQQGGNAKVTFTFGTVGGIGSITVDGGPIGLSSFNLNDSGTNGDVSANDGIWSANFSVPVSTIAPANYLLPFTLTDTANNTANGTLSLDVIVPPPANDNCAGAIALTSGVPFNGDNTQATSNDGAAAAVCPATNVQTVTKAVWFSFTPPSTGSWLVSSCGTTRDTVVTIFNSGITCADTAIASNVLACYDDNGPGCTGTAASVSATLNAGSTYFIRFADYSTASAGGAYTMVVTPFVTGACCNNTSGACTQTSASACTTGSSYQGDNVACPTTCAVVAVCCNNTSGACTSIYGGLCPSGTAQGSGTTCVANVTCPPSGACCNNATGACTFVYGGSSCPANTSFGVNAVCDAATCPVTGTCCANLGGACTVIYGGSCPATASSGTNTTCNASSCVAVGTCCDNVTSLCSVIYGGLCPANASFNGATSCTPAPCTPIAWACCFSDGSCLTKFQNDCTVYAGAVWAPGQTCGAYICPSCTNVLANPGAEAGDLSGWTIDVSGGNGWQATTNAGDTHSGTYAFATSYSLSRRHQTIDLTQFLTTTQLDAAPSISAGEWVHTRGDQGGQYYVLIQLLAADQTTVIASFNDGTTAALHQLPAGTPYTLVSNTFSGYGPGVRYLRFEDGGRDVSGWAGFYGTHFDDAFAGPTSVTSACCSPSTGCSVISNADCITAGGTPQACGTSCSPSPCPASGVCCRGSTCTTAYTTAGACAAAVDTVAPLTVLSKFVSSSSACNTPVTIPGTLGNTISPCCYANYNHNATLEVQDIFDFLNDWFAGKKGALVGGNGTTGTLAVQNIFDFLNSWFAGGCN